MMFSEIEVDAASAPEAFERAAKCAAEARHVFTTAPVATRVSIKRLIDRHHPAKGWEWVEMVRQPIDDSDWTKGSEWVCRR